MAEPPTKEKLLEYIIQDCKEHGEGDPITILDMGNVPYYRKDSGGGGPQPPYKHADFEMVRLVKEAYDKKPGSKTSLGKKSVKYFTWRSGGFLKKKSIHVYDVVATMHDYAFRPEYDVNAAADAAMLLTGPPEYINFRYFLFRNAQLQGSPHLFANDSPLLLLAAALQYSHTVKGLLEHSGFVFTKPFDQVLPALLQDLETKHGGTGFAAVFAELQKEMEGRWHSRYINKYKGHKGPGSYKAVSYKED